MTRTSGRDIDQELQFHVQMRTDEFAGHGLDPRAARHAALRLFGNPSLIQDQGYDVRGGGVLETIAQDVNTGSGSYASTDPSPSWRS